MIPMNEVMTLRLSQLEELLETEVANYCRLRDIESQKSRALIEGDTEKLNRLLNEEDNLSASLKSLESRRREMQTRWSRTLSLPDSTPLGELIERETSPRAERLSFLRQELLNLVKEIGRLNRSNEVLIQQSLSHVKQIFGILSGTSETTAYGSRGQRTTFRHRSLMDRSA